MDAGFQEINSEPLSLSVPLSLRHREEVRFLGRGRALVPKYVHTYRSLEACDVK